MNTKQLTAFAESMMHETSTQIGEWVTVSRIALDEMARETLRVIKELEAAERERDELRAEQAEHDAAACEPVSFEMKVHYSGIGKSGPWVKLNDRRGYEKLKVRHSGDADYEFRELYTAAPPAVLPPEMTIDRVDCELTDFGKAIYCAGYNQCRVDALELGARPQPVAQWIAAAPSPGGE